MTSSRGPRAEGSRAQYVKLTSASFSLSTCFIPRGATEHSKPPETSFFQNLVKPPGPTISGQAHDSAAETDSENVSHLPLWICYSESRDQVWRKLPSFRLFFWAEISTSVHEQSQGGSRGRSTPRVRSSAREAAHRLGIARNQHGQFGEAAFLHKATSLGLMVARPWGQRLSL